MTQENKVHCFFTSQKKQKKWNEYRVSKIIDVELSFNAKQQGRDKGVKSRLPLSNPPPPSPLYPGLVPKKPHRHKHGLSTHDKQRHTIKPDEQCT